MRNYDGRQVDYDEIESRTELTNKYKLPPEPLRHIEETWENHHLSDGEIKQLEDRSMKVVSRPFASGSKVAGIVLIVLFVVLPIALFVFNVTPYGLIATSIAVIVMAYAMISDRLLGKAERIKMSALKNNQYAAYAFNSPEKLWCVCSTKDGNEEQDHTAMDDEGNLYDFYFACGEMVFQVEEDEYMALSDKLTIVMFKYGKKTLFELLIK